MKAAPSVRPTLLLILALVVAISGTSPVNAAMGDDVTEIALVYETQLRGSFEKGGISLAAFVGLINRVREENPNTLFIGSGDDIAPSVLSSEYYGAHMIEALNAAGLDVNTYGNHEFDYGPDNLARRVAESDFTWVSANVIDRRTGAVFAEAQGALPFVILDVDGVKVGITGVAPAETPTASRPGPDVIVLDPAAALASVVPKMRASGAQVVIVIAHELWTVTERIAESVPGVDVFIGDHAHEVLSYPKTLGGAIVSRVGGELGYLGELTLRVSGGRIESWDFTLHDMGALLASQQIEPDPATLEVTEKYAALLPEIFRQVIGTSAVPLDARIDAVRSEESALGNFFADALRAWADADVAIINGGGLRGDRIYGPGPLTREDVYAIMPFGNYAVKLRVKGETIVAALDYGVGGIESLDGRFPHVSGLSFRFDPDGAPGSRVFDVRVHGAAIDPDAWYTLATYDFLADGGSGYDMLLGAERLIPAESGELVTSIVIEAIRNAGSIAPQVEGRSVSSAQD